MAGARFKWEKRRRSPFCYSGEATDQQYDAGSRERSTHHADAGAVRLSSAGYLLDRSERCGSERPCHEATNGRQVRPIAFRAFRNTEWNIGRVSLPVNVFCWLGW